MNNNDGDNDYNDNSSIDLIYFIVRFKKGCLNKIRIITSQTTSSHQR